MTPDGHLLCYTGTSVADTLIAGVVPTTAAPGPLADRGRTAVQAEWFGRAEWISFAVASPDGKSVYFSTFPESDYGPGQVRVTDIATAGSRVVYAPAGEPHFITAEESVRYLLLQLAVGPSGSVKLARLDLATGKVRYLPSGWLKLGTEITW